MTGELKVEFVLCYGGELWVLNTDMKRRTDTTDGLFMPKCPSFQRFPNS